MVATIGDLDARRARELDDRFQREIFPVLTPLGVGPGQPFPYISGLSLSLGVLARDPEIGRGALRPRQGARRAAALLPGRRAAAGCCRSRA